MKKWILKLVKDEKGVNTVEIVVLVAIVIGLALIFRDKIKEFIEILLGRVFNTNIIISLLKF